MRDGLTLAQAREALASQGITLSDEEAERLLARLPVRFSRRPESEDALATLPAHERADAAVLDEERARTWERIRQVLAAARARLPVRDAALLALTLEDGRKVAEIAAILGTAQKPLYERLSRLRIRLRREFEAAGIDADLIRDLLAEEE